MIVRTAPAPERRYIDIWGPFWLYGPCRTCGAWAMEPCFDMRRKLKDGMMAKELYKKHPCMYRRKR